MAGPRPCAHCWSQGTECSGQVRGSACLQGSWGSGTRKWNGRHLSGKGLGLGEGRHPCYWPRRRPGWEGQAQCDLLGPRRQADKGTRSSSGSINGSSSLAPTGLGPPSTLHSAPEQTGKVPPSLPSLTPHTRLLELQPLHPSSSFRNEEVREKGATCLSKGHSTLVDLSLGGTCHLVTPSSKQS